MITIFTDPHLNLRRQAHTTPAGLIALRDRLYDAVDSIISKYIDGYLVCAGDWFDKAHNDEDALLRSYKLAKSVNLIEGGNHDMENNAAAFTSLMAIKNLDLMDGVTDRVITAGFSSTTVHWAHPAGETLSLCMVPHHSTQELFEEALDKAITEKEQHVVAGRKTMLILHCNYNSPFATHETSLNLTEDDAEYLLEHFDYVLLGHEHQPRDLHQGRLIILGNTHPTSFADISDKRVAVWENDALRFETIWEAKGRYIKADHTAIASTDLSKAEFVHVTGEVDAGTLLGVIRDIKAASKEAPSLFMLRLDLTTAEMRKVERDPAMTQLTLPQRIVVELTHQGDEESLALWHEVSGT